MGSYRQYCPIARASEIMAERWTPLLVRNLMLGAHTFNDLSRGVPAMSRSMLAKRLVELEHVGVIRCVPKANGRGSVYTLTPAGADLSRVVQALGEWGERWVEVTSTHADPGFALWAWCQAQLDRSKLPAGRIVVAFVFPDQPPGNRYYWLLVEHGDAEVCYADPGGDPDLRVEAESMAFVDWHRGVLSWSAAQRDGRVTVIGPRRLARSLATWNLHAPIAPRS
ncbi:MAG: winged helix-turn-helix transcriptional regulator [Ilumatobacteraceae bacterium]